MININALYDKTDLEMLKALKGQQLTIKKAIKAIQEKIIILLSANQLKVGEQLNLTYLQEIEKKLSWLINSDLSPVFKKITNDFTVYDTLVAAEFSALGLEFYKAGAEQFKFLKYAVASSFNNIVSEYQALLQQNLYEHIFGVQTFNKLVKNVTAILTEAEVGSVIPLARYAELYSHDAVMDYFASLQIMGADLAGLTDFLYYGNIMASSRPFCIARAGRTYTKKQVESWQNWKWAGKKPGNIWIVRGGYHCRHNFRGIKKEWITNGSLKVGNYFDEYPEKYTASLATKVNDEIKRMGI